MDILPLRKWYTALFKGYLHVINITCDGILHCNKILTMNYNNRKHNAWEICCSERDETDGGGILDGKKDTGTRKLLSTF